MELIRHRGPLIAGVLVALALVAWFVFSPTWASQDCPPDDVKGLQGAKCALRDRWGFDGPLRVTGQPTDATCGALWSGTPLQQRRERPSQDDAKRLDRENALNACELQSGKNFVEVPCEAQFSIETRCFTCLSHQGAVRALSGSQTVDVHHERWLLVLGSGCDSAAMLVGRGAFVDDPLSWSWLAELKPYGTRRGVLPWARD